LELNEDLIEAVREGNAKAVTAFLRTGADANVRIKDDDFRDGTVLGLAASQWHGQPEIVQILLKAGGICNGI
jgi:hypothetical protein